MDRIPRLRRPHRNNIQSAGPVDKFLNVAIVGLATLLVAGLGVVFIQEEQAQNRHAQASSEYTPPTSDGVNGDVVRFAAVGDSITEANSPDIVNGTVGNRSWVHYAQSNSVRYAGGWADGGAQTAAMLDKFEPVPSADVLVVFAGTNDVSNDVPFERTFSNIAAIVETSGINQVVIASIPPQSENPERVVEFNRRLQEFVQDKDWDWVDASEGLREGNGWADGLTKDGVHPNERGAKILGDTLGTAIMRAQL